MKLTRALVGFTLIFSLAFISFLGIPVRTAVAQENGVALQRGYRTGYSDGYMSGYRDSIDTKTKDFKSHQEYADANRAYVKDYGPIEEYSDGYRQGFESGYDRGFEKLSFDSTLPSDLRARASTSPTETATLPAPPAVSAPVTEQPATADNSQPASSNAQAAPADETQKVSYTPASSDSITIPRDMELIIELQDDLSTEKNKPG